MKKITYFILLFFSFASCQNDEIQNKDSELLQVDLSSSKSINFSEIFSSVEIIQFSDYDLVASIDDIIFSGGKIVSVDNSKQHKVQVFSEKGDFLFSINSKGNGPGQFVTPQKVVISSSGESIFIYCPINKKILKFDFSGDFIGEIFLKEIGLIGDFIEKNDQIIFINVMAENKEKRIGKVDFSSYLDEPKIYYFNYPTTFNKIMGGKENFLFFDSDYHYFWFKDFFSNYFIKYNLNGEIQKEFYLNSNSILELDSSKVYQLYELKNKMENSSLIKWGESIVELNGYYVISVEDNFQDIGTLFINNSNFEYVLFDSFKNDMDEIFEFNSLSSKFGSCVHCYVEVIDSDFVVNRLSSMDFNFNSFKDQFESILKDKNENPIIFKYNFRDKFLFE